MKKPLVFALALFVAGTLLASLASAQQPPAPAVKPQKTPARISQSSAAKPAGVYRALRPSDGIDFAAYADKVELTSGGRPSGVLKRFLVVDINRGLQLTELELADTNFTDGHIKTKQFGDLIATSTNLLEFQFHATESQISKIKRFLATQPPKPNASQAAASGAQQAPAASAPQAPRTATSSLSLITDKDKVSYAIGINIGKSLKREAVDVDPVTLLRALQETLSGGTLLMTDQDVQATLTALQADVRKKMELQQQQVAEANRKEGDAFLAANKTKDGVVTLPSGLQYKILQQGTGPKPAATDLVTVNYRGTLLNGAEFDSSYKRGQPATFAVSQIIKGWTEALQLMPVGSTWQIFVPADLAYGARGAGPTIGPNSTLVFEVELLSIQPKAAPAVAAPAPATFGAPGSAPKPAAGPAPNAPAPNPPPNPNPKPPTPQSPTPTPTPTPKSPAP